MKDPHTTSDARLAVDDGRQGTLLQRLFTFKWLFWGLALFWGAFDLITKEAAEKALTIAQDFQPWGTKLIDNGKFGPEGYEWIPGLLHFKWAENYGAAFSIGADGSVPFTFISIGILGIVLYYVTRIPKRRWFVLVCLALITGGALGNLHDRFFHKTVDLRGGPALNKNFGKKTAVVRDFLYWPFDIPIYSTVWLEPGEEPRKYPIFNIADMGIVGGVIGICGVMLFSPEERRKRLNRPDPSIAAMAPPDPGNDSSGNSPAVTVAPSPDGSAAPGNAERP